MAAEDLQAGRVLDSVIAFLQEDEWRYEEIPGESAVRFSFTGEKCPI